MSHSPTVRGTPVCVLPIRPTSSGSRTSGNGRLGRGCVPSHTPSLLVVVVPTTGLGPLDVSRILSILSIPPKSLHH